MDKKIKILIVDDAPEWIYTHKNIIDKVFEGNTFMINTASSARDGFNKIIQEKDYNLVITDLEMEKDLGERYAGEWLIKNLTNRDEIKNTKFLIISGAYNIVDIAFSLKVDYIAKSTLISNPIILKYKLNDMLNLLVQ
jgi:DNA-binding NtrC family response regulator